MARVYIFRFTQQEYDDLLEALPASRPGKDPFGRLTRQWNLRCDLIHQANENSRPEERWLSR